MDPAGRFPERVEQGPAGSAELVLLLEPREVADGRRRVGQEVEQHSEPGLVPAGGVADGVSAGEHAANTARRRQGRDAVLVQVVEGQPVQLFRLIVPGLDRLVRIRSD